MPNYKRIILKLSGESLLPPNSGYGVSLNVAGDIAEEIAEAVKRGIEIGVVIGGGNIFRGAEASKEGMDRVSADAIGMLATIINSLALQEVLERKGVKTLVMSSVPIQGITEVFSKQDALQSLSEGKVVIFGGGTGHPYFSTDTAAVLRALQTKSDAILKATKVDGVYSADPKKDPSAVRYDNLSYMEVLKQRLKVMDSSAVSMCMDHKLPIIVFNMFGKGNLLKAVKGENIGTVVYE